MITVLRRLLLFLPAPPIFPSRATPNQAVEAVIDEIGEKFAVGSELTAIAILGELPRLL